MATPKKRRSFTTTALNTSVFHNGESLTDFIVQHTPANMIAEKMLLVVTSKIVSLAENRLVKRDSIDKTALIMREADHFICKTKYNVHLTVHHGILLPAAGIDESNSQGDDYILLPKDPYFSAKSIYDSLKKIWRLKDFGVLITDSHTTPLRRGVTGVALAHYGFAAVIDQRNKPDIFGRPLVMTTINCVDALAAAAVWCMGEADDQCPLAVIENANLNWQESGSASEIAIPIEEDLYGPLFLSLSKTKD